MIAFEVVIDCDQLRAGLAHFTVVVPQGVTVLIIQDIVENLYRAPVTPEKCPRYKSPA